MKRTLYFWLFFLCLSASGQVSEHFESPPEASSTLDCWSASGGGNNNRIGAGARTSSLVMGPGSILSLNTTSPISGTGSLQFRDSVYACPGCGGGYGISILTTARGVDGDSISFKLRIDSLSIPANGSNLVLAIQCGSFYQVVATPDSAVGTVYSISTVVTGSSGGGVVVLSFGINANGDMPDGSVLKYSLNIDDFYTTAALDPDNACAQALPVIFTDFSATAKSRNQVDLAWTTAGEANNSGFEIRRQTTSEEWQTIGFLSTEQPNKTNRTTYYWTDRNPGQGVSYYRIRQVDLDGRFTETKVKSVFAGEDNGLVVRPNPAGERFYLDRLDEGNFQYVQLVTGSGRIVWQSHQYLSDGYDIRHLPSGLYFIRVGKNQGNEPIRKLVKR